MADSARLSLKGDRELRVALNKLGDRMPEAVEKAMKLATLFLQGKVQETKLSGQVLKVRTGRLRSSINTRVKRIGPTGMLGVVGTNVVYARAHEFGYPPRNLPARPYLRPTFREQAQRVKNVFKNTIVDFAKKQVRQ